VAVTAAEALFWINLPAVLGCNLVIPYKLATLEDNQLSMPTMTATWLMPALPALVSGNSAAVVARVSPHQSQALLVVGERTAVTAGVGGWGRG
jgi:tellurite resistance protein TehA-like permease